MSAGGLADREERRAATAAGPPQPQPPATGAAAEPSPRTGVIRGQTEDVPGTVPTEMPVTSQQQQLERQLSQFIRHSGDRHSVGVNNSDEEACTVHVKGIGAKTGAQGAGRYENKEKLAKIFGRYGEVAEISVTHRVEPVGTERQNTSWAVVRFKQKEGAEATLKAARKGKIKPHGCSQGPFVVQPYSMHKNEESKMNKAKLNRTFSHKNWHKAKLSITVGSELQDQLGELRSLIGYKVENAEGERRAYDDCDDVELEAPCVLNPEGKIREYWDILQVSSFPVLFLQERERLLEH
eukprot:COSAG05_NODE_4846_length_1351_cov_1.164537_1_plen_295_part_00